MPIAKHEFIALSTQAGVDKAQSLSAAQPVRDAIAASVSAAHIPTGSALFVNATIDTAVSGTSFWTDSLLIDVRSVALA